MKFMQVKMLTELFQSPPQFDGNLRYYPTFGDIFQTGLIKSIMTQTLTYCKCFPIKIISLKLPPVRPAMTQFFTEFFVGAHQFQPTRNQRTSPHAMRARS